MIQADNREASGTMHVAPPEALLSLVVDLTDDAVISCDATSTVSFFSESAERLFGCASADIVGGSVLTLFPVHLADEMDRLFSTVVAGERVRHFESEIVRPDGLPIPVSLSLAPVPDAPTTRRAQCEHGWVMVARDVTEQHLAQATLAEIDSRLEESEALSHTGSWLWDLRTDAVQWSLEFHRIHDIDPLDFPGTFEAYMDLIDANDRDTVRTAMTRSVEASTPLDLEYRTLDADDKTRVIRIIANTTLGSDGKAVGLRGIGQDVSDQSNQRPGGDGLR
jgi:PAS domain S-box-containing protein